MKISEFKSLSNLKVKFSIKSSSKSLNYRKSSCLPPSPERFIVRVYVLCKLSLLIMTFLSNNDYTVVCLFIIIKSMTFLEKNIVINALLKKILCKLFRKHKKKFFIKIIIDLPSSFPSNLKAHWRLKNLFWFQHSDSYEMLSHDSAVNHFRSTHMESIDGQLFHLDLESKRFGTLMNNKSSYF